jgi:hypothetical protein
MPLVGFESMIPVFERAKTVHALERAATVSAGYSTPSINKLQHYISHFISLCGWYGSFTETLLSDCTTMYSSPELYSALQNV